MAVQPLEKVHSLSAYPSEVYAKRWAVPLGTTPSSQSKIQRKKTSVCMWFFFCSFVCFVVICVLFGLVWLFVCLLAFVICFLLSPLVFSSSLGVTKRSS